jgi:hypothetical protein
MYAPVIGAVKLDMHQICCHALINNKTYIRTRRMVSSGLLRRVTLVRTNGVTTQKTPFFIVTAVKTSNLTLYKNKFSI